MGRVDFRRDSKGRLTGSIDFELPETMARKYLSKQMSNRPWLFQQHFGLMDKYEEISEYQQMLRMFAKQLTEWADLLEHVENMKKLK